MDYHTTVVRDGDGYHAALIGEKGERIDIGAKCHDLAGDAENEAIEWADFERIRYRKPNGF